MGRGAGALGPGAAAVAVALVLTTACADSPPPPVRLRVGTFWSGPAAEALREELLTARAGLPVEDVELRLYGLSSLLEELLRGSVPDSEPALDLALVPNDWLGILAERAAVAELPAGQVEFVRAQVTAQAMLAASLDERTYAYPLAAETVALLYNAELLPTPPQALEDILAAPLPAGVLPFSVDVTSLFHVTPLLSCFQGPLQSAEGIFPWRPAAAQAVFRALYPLLRDPAWRAVAAAPDPPSLQVQLLNERRLASFVGGPWLLPALGQVAPALALAPVPPFRHAPHPARPLVVYQSVVLASRSPWSDLGHALAQRLLAPEAQRRLAARTARLPVLRGLYGNGLAVADVPLVGFLRAVEGGQPMPSSSRWQQGFRAAEETLRAAARAHLPAGPEEFLRALGGPAL